jgi:polyisoprenoid-binding protein YceI
MKFSFNARFAIAVVAVGQGFWFAGPLAHLQGQSLGAGASGKTFEVDTKASHVYVRVDPDGRGHAHGIVGQLTSGAITLGAKEKAGELVFDLTSFTADEPEARKYVGVEGKMSDSDRRSVTRTMLGSQVLDARQYPKATYTITTATPLDGQVAGQPGRYRFEGRLNLHGSEQPVGFEAKAETSKPGGALRLRGEFSLLQSDYHIKPYSAFFGRLKVKDELAIQGDLLLLLPNMAK